MARPTFGDPFLTTFGDSFLSGVLSLGGRRNGRTPLDERRRELLGEREDLRIDTDELERPTRNRERSRLNKILAISGALSTAASGFLYDEPTVATAVGEGLARGGATNLRRQRENLRRRRKAFRKALREARRYNREVEQDVLEARQERAFERTQQEREAKREQAAEEAAHQRKKQLVELKDRLAGELSPAERRKLDREIEATEALISQREASAEASRALAEQRRRDGQADASSVVRPAFSGSGGLPRTVEETEKRIDQLIRTEQKKLQEGAGSAELGRIQDQIVRLKKHRDSLRQSAGPADPASAPAPGATADTTRAGGVAGRSGAGGNTDPRPAVTLLKDVGGGGAYDARSTEQLVDDARTVAWERSPQEAERRLNALVEAGKLSSHKRDRVLERLRREREQMIREVEGQSPAAAILEDVARLDTLDEQTAAAVARQLQRHAGHDGALRLIGQASEAGRLPDPHAHALLDALGVE